MSRVAPDTLVVDIIGYNDLGTMFSNGVLHSTQLHTVERYRLIDEGRRLEGKYRYEDPGSGTAPYEFTTVFTPAVNQQTFPEETRCQEYNAKPVPMATKETAGKG